MIPEFNKNYKRERLGSGAEERIKLYMQDANGIDIKIRKKVSDMTQAETALELLYCQRDSAGKIDSMTRKIFSKGVVYQDEIFSLSTEAWVNWIDLRYNKDNNLITYPINISCMDGGYRIADAAECQVIIDLIFGSKEAILEGGRNLVNQVYDSSTISEVNNVTDER